MKFNQKKIFISTLIVIIALIFIHEFASNKKPPQNEALWKDKIELIHKSSNQNIIILQPYMKLYQYATSDIFYNKMDYLMQNIQPFIKKDKTVIIFPKDTGNWLFTTNENFKIHLSDNEVIGVFRFIIKHPFLFIKYYFTNELNLNKTLIQIKMNDMFEIYTNTFSKLAKKYNVMIVSGTIHLKKPIIKNNLLFLNENTDIEEFSFIFSSEGLPLKILNQNSDNTIQLNNNLYKFFFKEDNLKDLNIEKSKVIFYSVDTGMQKTIDNLCVSNSCYYLPFRGKIWGKEYNHNIILDSQSYQLQDKDYIFVF